MKRIPPSTVLSLIVAAVLAAALVIERRRGASRVARLEQDLYRAHVDARSDNGYSDRERREFYKNEVLRLKSEVVRLERINAQLAPAER